MNKIQLSLVLGFAIGVFVIFAYFNNVIIPMSQEKQLQEDNSLEYVWPKHELKVLE